MGSDKTLAMKLLEGKKVGYTVQQYNAKIRDAVQVAAAIGAAPEEVYKTLVVMPPPDGRTATKPLLVLLPAKAQLHLKKVAKELGVKKLKMATQKEAEARTGLQVGGISPLVLLNKGFAIYLDISARDRQKIYISAGQRGWQIQLSVDDLLQVTRARWVDAADFALGDRGKKLFG